MLLSIRGSTEVRISACMRSVGMCSVYALYFCVVRFFMLTKHQCCSSMHKEVGILMSMEAVPPRKQLVIYGDLLLKRDTRSPAARLCCPGIAIILIDLAIQQNVLLATPR